jgi:hypothetical protein
MITEKWSSGRDSDWGILEKGLDVPTKLPLSEDILSFPLPAPEGTFL